MKRPSRKGNNNLLLQLDDDILGHCDQEKLSAYAEDVSLGIRNFTLFQKFCNFKWPAWLNNICYITNPSFHHITPYLLLNNNYRDQVLIPNSNHYIRTDLTGMVSPLNDCWSIEFWILGKEKLFRPQENAASVIQTRDLKSYLINTKWEERSFKLSEDIYNIGHSEKNLKETVIDLNLVHHKGNIPHRLFVVIRPYNIESLGNVKSIEYNSKTRIIKINKRERLFLENKPEYFYTGNGIIGDITFSEANDKSYNTECEFGMATLALGYDINRGENDYKIRLNPGNVKSYKPVKVNYQFQKNEYIDNCRLRYRKGLKLIFPDNEFQNWFDGSRISALNHSGMELSAINQNSSDLKPAFYLSSGYNRMGLFSESKRIIDIAASAISAKNKPDFSSAINICYYIHSIADYFKLSRDIEHVRVKYKFIREAANILNQYSSGIKKKKMQTMNSIDFYLIQEYHLFDIIIIASSLFEFSYLARCLGIFNDEIKFSKESKRLEEIFLKELEISSKNSSEDDTTENKEEKFAHNIVIPVQRNEHFAYNIFAGFPFNLKTLAIEKLKNIADDISHNLIENPVYFKSIGASDTLFSIIFAVNLLMLKDKRAHAIIGKLFESGRRRYVLPDYTNPNTGHGTMGRGDSGPAISAFFMLLRSVIFIDSQHRLEIFPIPEKEWFSEGSEIKIENAPSIFGMVNFRCISTRNELQLYFYDMPKFIPPEIMINFPFPTRIKQEDDFIIKKETGNSYLIHGWPGMIRFKKK